MGNNRLKINCHRKVHLSEKTEEPQAGLGLLRRDNIDALKNITIACWFIYCAQFKKYLNFRRELLHIPLAMRLYIYILLHYSANPSKLPSFNAKWSFKGIYEYAGQFSNAGREDSIFLTLME
jgi:hypothetical protein